MHLTKKYIPGNQIPFMKIYMKRLKLRNKFLKTRNNTDKFDCSKQRNFRASFIRKEKTKYANLNIKDVTDKKFWKTIKPCFSDKSKIF